MVVKRFYLALPLVFLFILLICPSLCLAQYTNYNTTATYSNVPLYYPYQNSTYLPYQSSSYWPNLLGSNLDYYGQPYSYNTNAGTYIPSYINPNNPYGSVPYTTFGLGSLFYGNPYATIGSAYPQSQLYNPFGAYGLPLSLNSLLYSGIYPINNSVVNGNTNTNDGSATTNGNYTAQANTFYPAIYSGIQPYGTAGSAYLPTGIPLNPFTNYIPAQNYYQNPYASYPYNYGVGQTTTVNPYQNPYAYTFDPFINYPVTYQSQPLPYYQQNYTNSTQSNFLNVGGNWTGTWFTTLANGTVNNGEANLSLTQNATNILGNVTFTQNSYQKLSTNITGTVTGTDVSITGSLANGADIYTLAINGSISGNNLSGTYSINAADGSVVESGTFNSLHI